MKNIQGQTMNTEQPAPPAVVHSTALLGNIGERNGTERSASRDEICEKRRVV
jgi:hypothetical protein